MIEIYNTLTGKTEEFKPLIPGEVSMYVCGPTVYNYIHIGNTRPAIFFDTVRRYFEFRGYKVKYVQNFTDVDDKMINKANEEGVTIKDIADRYIKAYLEDTSQINLKEEGMIRPKATEHIGEMIEIINSLISKNFAYEVDGDVYFDVERYKDHYGELSKQNIEDLKSGARVDVTEEKRSPIDFALWKKSKENEPSWDSPFGKGRPGWHIECSAMSTKYLGASFDIHGGGQDLIFPHHENELAQSKCGCGGTYARYWMHNGYINIDGEKMSKSGSFVLLRDILKDYEGRVIRMFILGSYYRKPMDFSYKELEQTKSAIERIENSLRRVLAIKNSDENGNDGSELKAIFEDSKNKFIEAMDNDFNTAFGTGTIFELVRALNKFLDESVLNEKGKELVFEIKDYIINIVENVMGVQLKLESKVNNLTSELLEFILSIRNEARENKDFKLSDKIRDGLSEIGIDIKDGKDGTTWTI